LTVCSGCDEEQQSEQAPTALKSLAERVLPPPDYSLDAAQERMEYVRTHLSTQYHLIDTASMGQAVDRLKVSGVKGLRAVDARSFPVTSVEISLVLHMLLRRTALI
jgi:choline dehydrogenase-like flavoprotein